MAAPLPLLLQQSQVYAQLCHEFGAEAALEALDLTERDWRCLHDLLAVDDATAMRRVLLNDATWCPLATREDLEHANALADRLQLPEAVSACVATAVMGRGGTPNDPLCDPTALVPKFSTALVQPLLQEWGLDPAVFAAWLTRHGAVVAGGWPLQALTGLMAAYDGDLDVWVPCAFVDVFHEAIQELDAAVGPFEAMPNDRVSYECDYSTFSPHIRRVFDVRSRTGRLVQFIYLTGSVADLLRDVDCDVSRCTFDGETLAAQAPRAVAARRATFYGACHWPEQQRKRCERMAKYASRGFTVLEEHGRPHVDAAATCVTC